MAVRFQQAVGDLRFRHVGLQFVDQPIYANDSFDLGRHDLEDSWDIDLPTISMHHVRFRCIAYEEDGPVRVAPMVYARCLSKSGVTLSRELDPGNKASQLMSTTDPDVLLNHGDVLHLSPIISLEFLAAEHCTPKSDGLNETQRCELVTFQDRYRITNRRLGVGGNASVFVAIQTRTQRQVACKVVPVPFIDLAQHVLDWDARGYPPAKREEKMRCLERSVIKRREELPREYRVLKDLSHPNIVALEKVLYTPNNYYIFQELVTGGDLMSYVDKTGALTEPHAAVIVRQILKAVEYLHDNGVVHRDIKPENVLMASWREGARVVLTDFGQARTIKDAKAVARDAAAFRMQSMVGTLGYVAPEVLESKVKREMHAQGYSKAVDIWAVGCITAVLLTAELLFPEQGQQEDHEHVEPLLSYDLGKIEREPWWQSIGRKAKSFVRGCCVAGEIQRLTAKQALLHEWFTNKHYAQELEAAYQRAISDWMPRAETDDIVEAVDTGVPAAGSGLYLDNTSNTRSPHFSAPALQTEAQVGNSLFKTAVGKTKIQ